jgi:hypothetical protein
MQKNYNLLFPQKKIITYFFLLCLIKRLRINTLATVVSSIKILAIALDILSLDIVIGLMRCFPCLEKLYIQVQILPSLFVFIHFLF